MRKACLFGCVALVTFAVLALAVAVWNGAATINVTPSVPRGLYRLHPVTLPLTVGQLVVTPAPASIAPWVTRPLLKPVAALAGQTVCVLDGTLAVLYGPYTRFAGPVLDTDTAGRPLPHLWEGCHLVPDGHVFLLSPSPRSLDGRYFGSTPIAAIPAVATPLLTLGGYADGR